MATPPETEKEVPYASENNTYNNEGDKQFANAEDRRQSIAGGEAGDIYGNTAEYEEFGYVERGYVLIVARLFESKLIFE
jgi:hypothetical protein